MNTHELVPLARLEPRANRRRRAEAAFRPVSRLASPLGRPTRLLRSRIHVRSETGAATAEYAITTLAAVGFAGLLVVVLRSSEVRGMLTDIVRTALSLPA